MRKCIREFVKICAETLPLPQPVYEFGSLQVPGQKDLADLRPIFHDKQYVGCDMREGPGVDKILNLHQIQLPQNAAGTVLLLDTLEHVEYVRKAIDEVHRILKPNGILIASSVMKFHIHDFPHDYWRFTPEAFRSLLQPFNSSFVDFAGDKLFPHTVVGIGFKEPVAKNHMSDFTSKCNHWKKRWRHPPGKLRKALLKLLTHPASLNIYKKGRR